MIVSDITKGLKQLSKSQRGYKLYNDYYDGNHQLAFATEKFRSLFSKMFGDFSDNMCPTVVDAVADRLVLTGFEAITGDLPQAVADSITEIWDTNQLELRVNEVHNEALVTGDAYVIVWPSVDDPKMPTIYPNCADKVTVSYDPEVPGRILWAMKTWLQDDDTRRLNMYYPDRLERYLYPKKTSGYSTIKVEDFEPLAVDPVIRHDFGRVPVFHFPNNAPIGYMGRSELKTVKNLQDGLNKAITDMLVAMEYVALPQRWVTGMTVEDDPQTGQAKWPFKVGVDRLWVLDDPKASFGEFAAADLTHFLKTQDSFRTEIARVSRTPLHYVMLMTGDFPSGESQKTAEAPFLAKVKDRMLVFGSVWVDVLLFALQMYGVNSKGMKVKAKWVDPAPKSSKEEAATYAVDQTLAPPMLRRRGYTEDDIAEVVAHQNSGQNLQSAMEKITNVPTQDPGTGY